ncbi:MAG: glycosyltransferase family 39 protein [Planctomycetota bacterium]|nr:glycosyltransferase family 39 protein [Planctomycetota bacterium]
MMSRKLMLLLGALWTVVALTLGTRGLWYDEIAAWRDYGSPAEGRAAWWCLTHWFDPANHPLQTFASRLSFQWFSWLGGELALRLPSIVAGLATAIILWRWTEKRSGPAVGVWAGALAFTNPMLLEHATEARGYAFMMLAGALSLPLADHLHTKNRTDQGTLLKYAIVQALGVGTHLTTAFLTVGHSILGLSNRSWRLFLASSIAALLAMPLLWPVLDGLWLSRDQLTQTAGAPQGGYGLLRVFGGQMAFGWLLIPVMAHGLLRCRQDVRRVLLGPIVGLFVLWVTIMLSGSWAYTRFGLFALPAVVVALAHSLVHLLPSGRLLVLALQMYPLGLVVLVDKQPVREAMLWTLGHTEQAPLVVGLRGEVAGVYAGTRDVDFSLCGLPNWDFNADLNHTNPEVVMVMYPNVADVAVSILPERGFRLDHTLYGRLGESPVFTLSGNKEGSIQLWTRLNSKAK